jgi:hypothetical protein
LARLGRGFDFQKPRELIEMTVRRHGAG